MSKKEQIFFFILLAFFDNQQVITKQNEKYTHSKYNTPKQKSHINIKSTFIHRHCKVHFENWQYGKNNQFQQANTFNQKELREPEFLILDEPVNGLDPTGIIELRELLKKLVKEREVTILISSHILSELHQLATCYGFLHKGELLKQISTEELNEECKRHICLRTDNIQKTTLLLEQKGNINNYSVYPDNSIRIYECLDNVRMISKLLSSNGVIIDEISVQGENLETYFENLIGGRKNV